VDGVTSWTRRGVLAAGAAGAAGALAACSTDGPLAPVGTSGGTTPAGAASQVPWQRLRRSVTGRLALPSDPAYAQARLLENPRYDAQRPLAVLTVASPADVATAFAFAQDHDLPVAVRSGGHGYPGWSGGGSPPALVVDCRRLSRVEVSGASATVGAGAPLARVYDAIGRAGRAVAGGSCATVGFGGLTLGGGVGVLTRALGLTCDAVTAMRVVLADGRVVTASASSEPDLYWALRGGGGGHLGVVTSFRMATSVAPDVHTVYLQWPLSAAPQVVEVWQQWAPHADARLWSTLKGLGGRKRTAGPVLLLSGTWVGPLSSLDRQLAGLLDHVPAPSMRSEHSHDYRTAMLTYAGCAAIPVDRCTTDPGGALSREAFGATSHVAYAALPAAGIDTLVGRVEDAQTSGLLEAGISMDALGGRAGEPPASATAFVHRRALATVQYTATFPPGTATAADRYVRGFRAALTPHWGHHAYVNYADASIKAYRQAYFGANASRLAAVRAAYDPHGFFTQPQDF
jgi:FAD/FMN-containing dehydrogenase